MYTFIIVDDEKLKREELAAALDWEGLGFRLAGAFEDGADAIGFINGAHVDVVLTDIFMFNVSGVELAKYVFENHPGVKVVLISGREDFAAAREALKYGVCDYLVRPLKDIGELRGVFARARSDLDDGVGGPYTIQEYHNAVSAGERLLTAIAMGRAEQANLLFGEWRESIGLIPRRYVRQIIHDLYENLRCRTEWMDAADNIYGNGACGAGGAATGAAEYAGAGNACGVYAGAGAGNAGGTGAGNAGGAYAGAGGPPDGEGYSAEAAIAGLEAICRRIAERKERDVYGAIRRAVEYIRDNLSAPLTVEDIANSVYLSASYFSSEYKRLTGESVGGAVHRMRMETAAALLRQKNRSVKDVSRMSGYSDVRYFYKAFKKHMGCTVGEFQRMVKTEGRQ